MMGAIRSGPARAVSAKRKRRTALQTELRKLLNAHSAESGSDTPDFILAAYLLRCLDAFDETTLLRDTWWRGDGVIRAATEEGAGRV